MKFGPKVINLEFFTKNSNFIKLLKHTKEIVPFFGKHLQESIFNFVTKRSFVMISR